jgi:acetyltransferase-like isoleucine patch superfamily enzyme
MFQDAITSGMSGAADTAGDVLVGFGNHGSDIKAIADRCGVALRIYDDGGIAAPLTPSRFDGRLIVGVNNSSERRRIAERHGNHGARPLVDPAATIGASVNLGLGVVVAPSAVLLYSVTLGNHTHINYSASMTRCTVGDYCTIAPGAVICGNVEIGDECMIGASATICERSRIGMRTVIAAGAIVPPHSVVPNDTTVIGVWKSCEKSSGMEYVGRSASQPKTVPGRSGPSS